MYNRVILVGNLGRDPELRYMPSGTPVTNMNVATNEVWTDQQGQKQERTIWWRVAVWGKQAEACSQYLSKGRQVLVEGRMQPDKETGGPRIWTGQDGQPRASYEVNAQTVRFLGGRGDGAPSGSGGATEYDGPPPADEDEIPF
ncbi:MAG: single-stranded DNA-binding protein [Anaerolineales bacterium]